MLFIDILNEFARSLGKNNTMLEIAWGALKRLIVIISNITVIIIIILILSHIGTLQHEEATRGP